ncbi:hypothetical protein PDE_03032 [Penicillium oxalicum 114-2]|uniref:RRM domain-containing protein n=1 Tax=Penicillium oxalicum (strain 114-2 / CGMCC 5302) TaxID=933388 RepID=S7ZHC3_PENO1|nr:hypothetical protein PDE_03032 [Penicillium oxalicum 114-2]
MPFLGHEKGQTPRCRRSDDEYVLFLQGIPAHCRWQELKDLVRQTALHIRQAVVYDDSQGVPTGLGQIIIKNEDEAWRTYHRLSTNGWEGSSLVVTLARTSSPTKPVAGPTRSPPVIEMNSYMSGHSTPPRLQANMTVPPSPISSTSDHSGSGLSWPYPEFIPMKGPLTITHPPCVPMVSDLHRCLPPSPLIPGSMFDVQAWNMMPAMYPLSPPIHSLHDTARRDTPYYAHHNHYLAQPEWATPPSSSSSPVPYSSPSPSPRELLIHNLSSNTTEGDLIQLLQEAGTVEHCSMVTRPRAHPHSPSSDPHASVVMKSADEAKRASQLFHGTLFKGSHILVQLTTFTGNLNTIAQPPRGSWDESTALDESEQSDRSSDCSGPRVRSVSAKETGQMHFSKPLVVDGSGLPKKKSSLRDGMDQHSRCHH